VEESTDPERECRDEEEGRESSGADTVEGRGNKFLECRRDKIWSQG
jgi:hypothetical protein